MGNTPSTANPKVLQWKEIFRNIRKYLLIDIRKEEDFKSFPVKEAVNMPNIHERISEIKSNEKPVVLTCYRGLSSLKEAENLLIKGINAYSAENGVEGYIEYMRKH